MKDGLYTRHEVACIISEVLGDDCACNFNNNDEWLPNYCDFADTCWEQYLKHIEKKGGVV